MEVRGSRALLWLTEKTLKFIKIHENSEISEGVYPLVGGVIFDPVPHNSLDCSTSDSKTEKDVYQKCEHWPLHHTPSNSRVYSQGEGYCEMGKVFLALP